MAGFFGLAKRGLGLLGKKKPTPTPKPSRPKTAKEKHDEFMQKDPYERGAIISKRKSAERGDVYTGTSVVGTPSPHRSAKAIKKYSGPHSYQLTDPVRKRRGPKAAGGRIGLQRGGGSAPFLRGRSGATNIKAPRGQQGWKQMQAAEAKIPSKGLRVVKGNPVRQDQAQRLRAHRLRTKIAGARAGRVKQAQQKAFETKHIKPASQETKVAISRSRHPKTWRRAGKLSSGWGNK